MHLQHLAESHTCRNKRLPYHQLDSEIIRANAHKHQQKGYILHASASQTPLYYYTVFKLKIISKC